LNTLPNTGNEYNISITETLNVTDHVKRVVQMEGVGLVFFIIMTSLAIVIIIYTVAIMGYVIKMRDER
jgi:hypothetical protein